MSRPSIIFTIIASVCGPLLLWAWLQAVHIAWPDFIGRVERLNPWPIGVVVACAAANAALAGEKWRRVEQRLSGTAPARRQAIAYSLIGAALGQFLPIPLANALIRGGGNRLHLRAGGRRGALTSVWEQLFDLGVVFVLLPAAFAAILTHDARFFVVLAPLSALIADPLVGWIVPAMARLLRLPAALAERTLCTQLYRLSLARFCLLTIMTASVVLAMAAPIPMSALATSIPPVAASAVLSFLPAGLGVNEWSFLYILGALGVPGALIASFALVNRLVVAVVSLALGVVGFALVRLRQPAPAADPIGP